MAFFHGKSAKIYFPTNAIESMTDWTLTISVDTADTTAMGDTWKTHERGFDDFSATAAGYGRTTRATVAQVGQTGTLKLYIDGTNYLTATAFCTQVTESVECNDVGKISYAFIGNSATGIAYA